jgi:DNA repair exonuclease SbcCD nuclease subunit
MRFIHSADWQIGKVFKQFGEREEPLRQARLAAIERLGEFAKKNGAAHILVAGDLYDSETPTPVSLRAPIERMKLFPDIAWHLLPGNHDPHRPEGVWDRLARMGLPSHIHPLLTPEIAPLGDSAFLLPAPLVRKTEHDDISMWMDAAATPAGALRIGMAHGSVVDFGNEGEAVNPIDPARATKAGLDYFALGDWHGTQQVGPKTWYAGTPEPDRAGRQERGTALLVDIAGAGATPIVTPLATGTYRWLSRRERFVDGSELEPFEQRFRSEPDLSHLVLRLQLEGTLPVAHYAELEARLMDFAAAAFHLQVDRSALAVRPTAADLEAIDFDGVLRRSADHLQSLIGDPTQTPEMRHRAQEALVELYIHVVRSARKEAA